MKFDYTPSGGSHYRPMVPVSFSHDALKSSLEFMCLVDTGSPFTILHESTMGLLSLDQNKALSVSKINIAGERNAYEFQLDLCLHDDDQQSTYPIPGATVHFVDGDDLGIVGVLGGEVLHEFVTVFREKERVFHLRPLADLHTVTCPHTNGAYPL